MATTKAKAGAAMTVARPPALLINPPTVTGPLGTMLKEIESKLRFAHAAAAAGVKGSAPSRADKLFADWVAALDPAARKAAKARATALLAAAPVLKQAEFGRYAAVDVKTYKGADAAQAALGRLTFDAAKVRTALRKYRLNDAAINDLEPSAFARQRLKAIDLDKLRAISAGSPDQVEGAKLKKLGLFLNSVHCLESNELEDELRIGGVAVDPDGASHKISSMLVSSSFEDGDVVIYAGRGKLLHEWNIVRTGGWPHAYAAVIAMAEDEDADDHMAVLLEVLCDTVRNELAGALAAATGDTAASVIAQWFNEGPAVAAVGQIASYLFYYLGLENNLFGSQTLVLTLAAGTKSYYDWAGLTTAPPAQFPMVFTHADKGSYRCWMSMTVYP